TGGVSEALRPRYSDVQSIARHQEVEASRHVLAARGGHRVEDDGCLATLELIDGPDLNGARQPLAEQPHLRVVRRYDHHVVVSEGPLDLTVPERMPDEALDLHRDRLCLLF